MKIVLVKKRIINLVFILMLPFCNVFSMEIVPSEDLPLELQFLLESLGGYKMTETELKSVMGDLKVLDENLKKIPGKYIMPIVKSSIYRSILEYPIMDNNYRVNVKETITLTKKSIKIMTQKVEKKYYKFNSFVKWLVEALQSDMWDLIDTENSRKERMLLPWYNFIITINSNKLNYELRKMIFFIFKRIVRQTTLFVSFSGFKFADYVPLKDSFYLFKVNNRKDEVGSYSFSDYQKRKREEALKVIKKIKIDSEIKNSHKKGKVVEDVWIPEDDSHLLKVDAVKDKKSSKKITKQELDWMPQ